MKNQKIKALTFLLSCIITLSMYGQDVKKKTVVEHFTNTRCSVCASRNPGFYNALKQRQDIIHIAYHPSSPYSTCLFSTQNKAENDARTRYYDLFGGTPTFAINGEEKTSSQVQNGNVYNAYDNQKSPLEIKVNILMNTLDSIKVEVEISAVADHNLGNLSLYIPMIEDTVFYASPNNEKEHYDVFRKSFTGINPIDFNAPKLGGLVYKFTKSIAKNSIWSLPRLSVVAIISNSDKKVVQVDQSNLLNPNITSSSDDIEENAHFSISPNPAFSSLSISITKELIDQPYFIFNSAGYSLIKGRLQDNTTRVDISALSPGIYFIKSGQYSTQFIKH